MSRQKSYISNEIEIGSILNGALRKTLPIAWKAIQLLSSSSTRIQGENTMQLVLISAFFWIWWIFIFHSFSFNLFSLFLVLQVPIKWPKSRDEVWKANIPHTHLAHEKSDQNWMVVKGVKIHFPGGGTHFHYGADKYIASIANVSFCLMKYKKLQSWTWFELKHVPLAFWAQIIILHEMINSSIKLFFCPRMSKNCSSSC